MVIDEIRELLTAPRPAEAMPFLERLDSTLTAGYAHACNSRRSAGGSSGGSAKVAAKLVEPGGSSIPTSSESSHGG